MRLSLSVSLSRLRGEVRLVVSNGGILLTSLMESAQYFAYGVVETFLPLYLFSSGYSSAEIGPLFTVQVVAMALSKPALGRLSDRLGRRRFIAAGLVFGAVVVTLLPWATGYWALLALTAGFGLGMAAVTGSTSALVSDLSRSSAYGSALGVLGSIKDVGHAAGPAVVGFLVLSWGYRPAFGLVAACWQLPRSSSSCLSATRRRRSPIRCAEKPGVAAVDRSGRVTGPAGSRRKRTPDRRK